MALIAAIRQNSTRIGREIAANREEYSELSSKVEQSRHN
jgi:hypothetical protein